MDSLDVLGSKPRLELLRLLSRRDMYVSELMEEVGMDGKTATHHLDILTDADILRSYKDGRRRYYTLVREVRLEITPSPNRRFVARFPSPDKS
ncbi:MULTISPECIES: helix-turn-helix domain-containing protein [Halorubrum]|uniref:ArsR family transcriptional regulator n=1 Tax=Halorubrum distributum JCM 13916 TaxID=1230455 RepID=M0PS52_9EURY|nr:ArsR family transcriptional regulator [Halorubrum arcis JCM 13916]